ncbi:2-O-methyltransferase NoeI [Phycisphaerales bacterium]|nr:2-O-methyltransferase NoeI [Phycisphaerales bacterium]
MEIPFSLIDMLGPLAPTIRIVDVGASDIGETPPYVALMARPQGRLVGFEPDDAARGMLNASDCYPGRCLYLPDIIGDGSERNFHLCNVPMTSSLYRPNTPLLRLFINLEEVMRVESTRRVKTRRLDDVPQVDGLDFLKIDVQGAELDVFKGAPRLLSRALVVHTEVEFVPMYEGQPLFSDVDQFLRSQGFLLHSFLGGMSGRTFRPMAVVEGPTSTLRQHLWADVVYVRDFGQLAGLSPGDLLKLAVILHECYGSCDLAALVLYHYDLQTPGRDPSRPDGLWGEYFQRLCGEIPTDRPLV